MATYLTKKFKMITRMRNNKGFTLIELIMVTILLGILAAVAVPRYLGTVSKAEEAVEKGVVTQLRIAVEEYSNNQYIEYGRYQYPSNPFDIVEVEGYLGEVGVDFNYYSDDIGLNGYDGSWWIEAGDIDGMVWILHGRKNNTIHGWTYYFSDVSSGASDDRGLNVGDGTDQFLIYNDNGQIVDCDGNPEGSDAYQGHACYSGPSQSWNGECVWGCGSGDEDWLSNNW